METTVENRSLRHAHGQLLALGAQLAHCGREPGLADYDSANNDSDWPLTDYSTLEETLDQQEINRWLQQRDLQQRQILHIGIGNSSVARMALPAAARVCGLTVAENEWRLARRLQLPRYEALLCNKYSPDLQTRLQGQQFDYILDNNLASFVCCCSHMESYLATLCQLLAPDGVLLTHWAGMQWVLDRGDTPTEAAWILDEARLGLLAQAFALQVQREGDVFVLRHA